MALATCSIATLLLAPAGAPSPVAADKTSNARPALHQLEAATSSSGRPTPAGNIALLAAVREAGLAVSSDKPPDWWEDPPSPLSRPDDDDQRRCSSGCGRGDCGSLSHPGRRSPASSPLPEGGRAEAMPPCRLGRSGGGLAGEARAAQATAASKAARLRKERLPPVPRELEGSEGGGHFCSLHGWRLLGSFDNLVMLT